MQRALEAAGVEFANGDEPVVKLRRKRKSKREKHLSRSQRRRFCCRPAHGPTINAPSIVLKTQQSSPNAIY
jgi:hypothetical protein